ncbi:MAG: hypothetical protein ABIZ04_22360 [Opitutus sp.]
MVRPLITVLTCAQLLLGATAYAQATGEFEQPPISYSATTPRSENELKAKVESAELRFAGDEKSTLKALLAALNVPVESQLLVFSKTSLQRRRISPEHPRALYFSDSIYVGWVPGGMAEITLIDPQLGPVFYSFDLRARNGSSRLERDADCLRCHGGTFVRDIPGVLARSLFTDPEGEPVLRHGSLMVDDTTPFTDRWGGWYVTGYHGTEAHRGNFMSAEEADGWVFKPAERRPDTLKDLFDISDYLRPTSDVVALLVFEHQTTMQNSLTRANMSARRMLAYQHGLQKAFNEPLSDEPRYDSVKSVFESTAQDVVDRLLFRDAAPLPSGVVGDEAFQERFSRDAPHSAAGHTLKDLQLWDRIFTYRCSYLIYSDMFLELPEPLKVKIYDRLRIALLSREPNQRYSYLPSKEKQQIYEILRETHREAKQRWN